MNLIELIGFLVTMVALTFLYFKRMKDEKRRREHPEIYEEEILEEREEVARALRALDHQLEEVRGETAKMKTVKVAVPSVQKKRAETKKYVRALPDASYSLKVEGTSPAAKLIHVQVKPKNFILYHEILGRPKALKEDDLF